MYTGMVIDELMQMVARAEDHAQDARLSSEAAREQHSFESHFMYAADSQPMLIGVA